MAELRTPPLPLSIYNDVAEYYPGLDPVALYNNNILQGFSRDYIAALDKEVSQYGLAIGRHLSLMRIWRSGDDGCAPADVADAIGVTRGAVTGLIDSLVEDGYVRRTAHETDRRKVTLTLTPDGRRKIDEYYPPHARTLCGFMNTLTKQEQDRLVKLLGKLSRGLKTLTG